jgi:hypothetical protein
MQSLDPKHHPQKAQVLGFTGKAGIMAAHRQVSHPRQSVNSRHRFSTFRANGRHKITTQPEQNAADRAQTRPSQKIRASPGKSPKPYV